jgi:hypothetical protein
MNLDVVLNELENKAANMTQAEKDELQSNIDEMLKRMSASTMASKFRYDKAFLRDGTCLKYGKGEYHVYMWLHADGTPFYVGMGKADRWKDPFSRNESFYVETSKLDALVVKVIDGLLKEEALEAEFCLSHYLSYNDFKLANCDNNFALISNEERADRKVGKYVRLLKKEYNAQTIAEAKKKIHPYKMDFDIALVREYYAWEYGNPA